MFRTYLKFAVRTFWRDKLYTLLNIFGLALGLAVSLIILLYLQNDLTYDQHHAQHERVHRLATNIKGPGVEWHMGSAAREVAPLLAEHYPEIESFVRFEPIERTLVNIPTGERYNEEDWMRADSSVFRVFTHAFLAGDPRTALRQKNSVVLTESLAQKYFGTEAALGQTLLLHENKESHTVTGVIEDLPDNSHLKFDALVSHVEPRWQATQDGEFNSEAVWNVDVYTYLLFPEGYNSQTFFDKLPPFYNQYIKPFGDQVDGKLWFYLEPLADVHFYSEQEDGMVSGNLAYLYAFGGIGIFILLLACINYMNMATARSGQRAKEISVRKVLGSSRQALILSFLSESLILSALALLLAWGIVAFVLYATPFNNLIEKKLTLDLLENSWLLGGSVGLTLLVGLLSGLYPALYLPSLSLIKSLKGSLRSSASGITLRKSLVVIQFTVSIAVVICTLLMRDQIRYVRSQELGFDREHLLLISVQDTLVRNQLPVIKNELERYGGVVSTTAAYGGPGRAEGSSVFGVEIDSVVTTQSFERLSVGEDYLETMGISLLAGRDFRADLAGDIDGRSFIINETAARQLGWYEPAREGAKIEDALHRGIRFFHGEELGSVVGVVEDFNVGSLHHAIEPTIIVPSPVAGSTFYVRLRGDNLPVTMEHVRDIWTRYDPNHPFEYAFLDEEFDQLYRADERQSTLISVLAGICLLISLLGVLGLSAFTAEQRTKEIGVRKVLGASVAQIVYLLFRDVMGLVMIASVLAAPIAYWLVRQWLQNFAYRTEINVLLFLLAAGAALLISFLTMSFHSIKTARLNPVESLRYE